MLLIFGMRNRVHQHGPAVAASCARCHNEVVLLYLVVTRWFTLFFVPIVPFGRRRMLVCPICSWQREVPNAQEHLALDMIEITSGWQRHEQSDDEYGRRVEAFWSFMTQEPGPSVAPSDPSGTPPSPPAPPPTPPSAP